MLRCQLGQGIAKDNSACGNSEVIAFEDIEDTTEAPQLFQDAVNSGSCGCVPFVPFADHVPHSKTADGVAFRSVQAVGLRSGLDHHQRQEHDPR